MSTPELPHDRESKATRLAVEVALRNQVVDQRLDRHEARLIAMGDAQTEIVRSQKAAQRALDTLENKIDTAAEIAKAVADKGVSTRTFYMGIAGLAVSLGAILAGTGHV